MTNLTRTYAEVSIDALYHNLSVIRRFTDAKIMAVVKADAYGHGAVELSRILTNNGIDYLGVACIDEALQLRKAGIHGSILVLGYMPPENAVDAVMHDVEACVYSFSGAKAMSNAALRIGKTAKLHIKIDTGMSRLGFVFADDERVNRETIAAIADIASLPNIQITGVFSHPACADESNDTYTDAQFARYDALCRRLESLGIVPTLKHFANSAATLRYPHTHLDMVRVGIALYGVSPTSEDYGLLPVMSLRTRISHIKTIPAGTPVSYGARYVSEGERVVATIPAGYADGYSRTLFGKARCIVGDTIVPVIGNICMDQCMIDITGVNTINIQDEVILIGGSGDHRITVSELATHMGTIPYEVLCVIGKRVPRIYKRSGSIVGERNEIR